jgi:type IX secretion system PorP/SprF family membrane protein
VNEQAGYQGMLRHTGAVAAYAHQVYLNDQMTFGGGLSLGLFSRRIDVSRITTSSQFANGSFDPSAGLGEDLNAASRTYLTLTPGLSWSLLDEAGENKAFLGVSLFNANRPDVSFTGQPDRMTTQVLLNGGYRICQKEFFELMPTFRYIWQRGSSQTNIGVISRFNFRAEGLVKPGSVGVGTWYSVKNAAIISLEITQPGYFINFSYDLPATDKTINRRVTNAVEVSVGWRRNLKAKAKSM